MVSDHPAHYGNIYRLLIPFLFSIFYFHIFFYFFLNIFYFQDNGSFTASTAISSSTSDTPGRRPQTFANVTAATLSLLRASDRWVISLSLSLMMIIIIIIDRTTSPRSLPPSCWEADRARTPPTGLASGLRTTWQPTLWRRPPGLRSVSTMVSSPLS